MDESDLIKRTKNSLKAKKSRAEIMKGFQDRGYKLEYADKILQKVSMPKKVITTFSVLLAMGVLIVSAYYLSYSVYQDNPTPNIITGRAFALQDKKEPIPETSLENEEVTETNIPALEITSEMITDILYSLGAKELNSAPFYGDPVINFKIDEKDFYSKVSKSRIETFEGLSSKADLEFTSTVTQISKAFSNINQKQAFKDSVAKGETTVDILASNTELFTKGYLSFYESLK